MKNSSKEQSERSLLNNLIHYSSSNIYRRLLGLINAILKPKLLTPELYGLWSLLSLIPNYAMYSDLGARESMRLAIPYHDARNEQEMSRALKDSAYFGSLYLRIVCSLALLVAAVFIKTDMTVRSGLATMAVVILLKWHYEYTFSLLKAYQHFQLAAQANYLRATISVGCGVLCIYLFGIYGAYLSIVLAYVSGILYLRSKFTVIAPDRFIYPLFTQLVRTGLPIMLFNLLVLLIRSCDRFIIAALLGQQQLGYYSIAIMFFGFLMQIPGATREVIEPRLMQSLADEKEDHYLREYCFKPLLNTAYYLPFLIGGYILLSPLFIQWVLPKYQPGLVPSQILAIGGFFLALTYITRGIFYAKKLQVKVLKFLFLGLLINVGLDILLIRSDLGLSGVALGSGISFFFVFFSLYCYLRFMITEGKKDWARCVLSIFQAFLVMMIVLIILHWVRPYVPWPYVVVCFINLITFYLAMGAHLWFEAGRNPLLDGIQVSRIFSGRRAGKK